jgi:NDP-sugar pyrophosphorylase family protein
MVSACLWWVDFFEKAQRISKSLKLPVVIMAGGEGVRLAPYTKILPKPLMPIGDTPVVEMIIDRFSRYGCNDFYLSLNYKANLIKAYFSDFEHKYKINYILENKPLGTAGSLHLLKTKIRKTFFVSNCDVLIEADYADMLKFHSEKKNKITLISSMKNFTIPYGVCEIQRGGILKNIHEKPEHDFLVNTGMYILEPAVLADIPANRFYNMTDLINDYLEKGEKVGVYPVSDKAWLDIGQFEALSETLKKFEVKA